MPDNSKRIEIIGHPRLIEVVVRDFRGSIEGIVEIGLDSLDAEEKLKNLLNGIGFTDVTINKIKD